MTDPDRAPAPLMLQVTDEDLISIYLSGVSTGVGSALATWAKDLDDDAQTANASRLLSKMVRDPIAMEEVYNQIKEILEGEDSGPKAIKLY